MANSIVIKRNSIVLVSLASSASITLLIRSASGYNLVLDSEGEFYCLRGDQSMTNRKMERNYSNVILYGADSPEAQQCLCSNRNNRMIQFDEE